jgi:hypothetical protein
MERDIYRGQKKEGVESIMMDENQTREIIRK